MSTNTLTFNEINKSSFSYLLPESNEIGVYLIRIKLPYENKYKFKVGGTTKDLIIRVDELEREFHYCDGEIIVLFYGKFFNIRC